MSNLRHPRFSILILEEDREEIWSKTLRTRDLNQPSSLLQESSFFYDLGDLTQRLNVNLVGHFTYKQINEFVNNIYQLLRGASVSSHRSLVLCSLCPGGVGLRSD
ncbi:hypothetical protein FOYG_16380 [Fusarium oxysporum NRRL 32931]|uniref:Uncharacterized protein n=1 Tax=Fusarium oxysporum NRRL 32931 TaxID=660029 RepID=W9HDS8_FUSOX|nr:hypothetical protein FOYG_16380 [Fusarium oxysporum NRRL 32931]